jgi:hypothetical protein
MFFSLILEQKENKARDKRAVVRNHPLVPAEAGTRKGRFRLRRIGNERREACSIPTVAPALLFVFKPVDCRA